MATILAEQIQELVGQAQMAATMDYLEAVDMMMAAQVFQHLKA
jgi:hypothetical protein